MSRETEEKKQKEGSKTERCEGATQAANIIWNEQVAFPQSS